MEGVGAEQIGNAKSTGVKEQHAGDMGTEPLAPSNLPKEPVCWACRTSISPGAKKCITCDCFQGWRRFLDFSSTTLSLLIALITVSTFAGPRLASVLHPPQDQLKMQLIDCSPSRAVVKLAVTNFGERPGAIRRLQVEGPNPARLTWELELLERFAIAKAGEVEEHSAYSPYVLPDLVAVGEPPPSAQQWVLIAEVIHSSGVGEAIRIPFMATSTADTGQRYPALIVFSASLNRYAPEERANSSGQWDATVYVQTLAEEDVYVQLEVRPQAFYGPYPGPSGPEIESIRVGEFIAEEFQVLVQPSGPMQPVYLGGEQYAPQYREVERVFVDSRMLIAVNVPPHQLRVAASGLVVTLHNFMDEELGRKVIACPDQRP